jgi:hypothetical protein
MAKMTKKKLIELIRESVEECMNVNEDCPGPMPGDEMGMDMHAAPESMPMEPMDGAEQSKMDQLLDMMQQVLMKLDGGASMDDPPPIEMKESKRKRKSSKTTKK